MKRILTILALLSSLHTFVLNSQDLTVESPEILIVNESIDENYLISEKIDALQNQIY